MEEKESTVPESSAKQQLPVEVAVEDKPSQMLSASPLYSSSANVKHCGGESSMSDNLVRFFSI